MIIVLYLFLIILIRFITVKKFANAFSSKDLNIDMLILNAAVVTPQFVLSVDGLETQVTICIDMNIVNMYELVPLSIRS
jgi:uncharacterized membrane protein (DUF441 family)